MLLWANARKIYFNFCRSSFPSLGLAENATSFCPSPVRWSTAWWELCSLYKLQLQLGLHCWWLAPHSTNRQAAKVSCLCPLHHAVGTQWAKHSTSSFSKVWTNCHLVHMPLISQFFSLPSSQLKVFQCIYLEQIDRKDAFASPSENLLRWHLAEMLEYVWFTQDVV